MNFTDTEQGTTRIAPHTEKYPQQEMPAPLPNVNRPSATLPAGAVVLTLQGALPVELLRRGHRVVTKSGACALKRIRKMCYDTYFALEFDKPEVVYILDDHYWPSNAAGQGRQKS